MRRSKRSKCCFLRHCCFHNLDQEDRQVVQAGDILEPSSAAPKVASGELETQAIRVVSHILQHQVHGEGPKVLPKRTDSLGIDDFDDDIFMPGEDEEECYEDAFSPSNFSSLGRAEDCKLSLLDLAIDEVQVDDTATETAANANTSNTSQPEEHRIVEIELLLVVALIVVVWCQLYRKASILS